MAFKLGLLVVLFAIGCSALPAQLQDEDMSIFFEHVDPESRIVGGNQAAAGSHPHMVAMTNGNVRSFVCGGSVISQRAILTAAHCIAAVVNWGSLSSTLRVTVGTNRWNSGGQTYALRSHNIHPQYDNRNIKNDIGFLFPSSLIQLHALVRVLPVSGLFAGANIQTRVAGWGRTSSGGALAANLMELQASTLEGNDCANRVRAASQQLNMAAPAVSPALEICTFLAVNRGTCNVRLVSGNGIPGLILVRAASQQLNMAAPAVSPALEICTFLAVNRGTCNGDSGSALVRTDWGQQIGIVSWGLPCARGAPDMFVRVSAFASYIAQNM